MLVLEGAGSPGEDQPARSRYRQYGDGGDGAMPGDPQFMISTEGVFTAIYRDAGAA